MIRPIDCGEDTGPRRGRRAVLAAATVGVAALYLFYPNAVPDARVDQADDSFHFLRLAHSLLRGEGYQTKHWQPGFPVLLSLEMTVVGLHFRWLKLFALLAALIAVVASFRWYRHLGLGAAAWPLALLLAATPLFFDYAHRLLSEVPYLAFAMVGLAALSELSTATTRRQTNRAGLLLTVSTAAALLIRGNGLALVPALAIDWYRPRSPNPRGQRAWLTAALVAALAVFVSWMVWGGQQQFTGIDNVTYLQEVRAADFEALWRLGALTPEVERVTSYTFARRVYENVVWHMLYQIDALAWPGGAYLARLPRGIGFAAACLLLAPAWFGVVQLGRRAPAALAYLVCSLLLVAVYPNGGSARYLLPCVPVWLAVFYLGFERLLGGRGAVSWLAVAFVGNLALCAAQAHEQAQRPYLSPAMGDVLDLIREELPRQTAPSDVIVSSYHVKVQALVERRAAPTADLIEALAGTAPVYVLELDDARLPVPAGCRREPVARRGVAELSRLVCAPAP